MSIIMDGSDPLVFRAVFQNGIRELTWPKTMMLKTAHIDSDVFELVYNKTQTEPEWTGEGIPPSGTSCEMRRAEYVNVGWQKIEFLFAGSKKAFFRDEQGHEWSRPLSDLKFRSVRTLEQIAAEKRDAAIKEMQRLVGSCNTFPFAELYDYGYRLQVAE